MTHYLVAHPDRLDYVFIFKQQALYVNQVGELICYQDVKHALSCDSFYCFAESDGKRYLLPDPLSSEQCQLNETFVCKSLKQLWCEQVDLFGSLGVLACHLNHWRLTHRYCGSCAQPLRDKLDERALICQSCDQIFFPRISPAIIVLVRKGDEVLLAQSTHVKTQNYGTLAGFVEPGETIEEAVHREVYEEVGLYVKNLRYLVSQPWPFPDSLMLGFHADYDKGEIAVDGDEIVDAQWFRLDNLPKRLHSISISQQLIELYKKEAG